MESKRYKILTIDDEERWHMICEEAFPRHEYELLTAKNISEAKNQIGKADGIIMNMHIDGTRNVDEDNSWEILLNHIKKNYSKIPRIVLTGYIESYLEKYSNSFEDFKENFRVDYILTKPKNLNLDKLKEKMNIAISKRIKKIFISYAIEDYEIAERLYDNLKNEGMYPWIAPIDIYAGQDWKREIRLRIEESNKFLILLSSTSVSKREGYVCYEQNIALERLTMFSKDQIFIIPVRIDDCVVPEELKQFHYVDLFPSYEDGFQKILKSINS